MILKLDRPTGNGVSKVYVGKLNTDTGGKDITTRAKDVSVFNCQRNDGDGQNAFLPPRDGGDEHTVCPPVRRWSLLRG